MYCLKIDVWAGNTEQFIVVEQRHLVGAALKTILIFMGNNSDLNKKIIKMFKMYPAVIMHLFKLQG